MHKVGWVAITVALQIASAAVAYALRDSLEGVVYATGIVTAVGALLTFFTVAEASHG